LKARITESLIAFALRQAVEATPVIEICHKMKIVEQTLNN